MRAIILVVFVLAPFLTIIYGEETPLEDYLDRKADDGKFIINDIIKPIKGGYLGNGSFSVIYKCTLLKPTRLEVAMKFTPSMFKLQATREYEMYTYLNAINDTRIEKYGIPSVHYFGVWDDYILMAITLFNSKCNVKTGPINEVDGLIVCRDFIRIMKYIHSCGVLHNDIKLDNIMYRDYQAFIIDFNLASKMFGQRRSAMSSSSNNNRKCLVKRDWEKIFYSMCIIVDIEVNWLNTKITMERIEKIKFNGLKIVLVQLAKYLFESTNNLLNGENELSIYDQFYKLINNEIGKFKLPKPVLVSWLSREAKQKGKEESTDDAMTIISSIKDPLKMSDVNYPEVKPNYFGGLSHAQSAKMAKEIQDIIEKLKNQKLSGFR